MLDDPADDIILTLYTYICVVNELVVYCYWCTLCILHMWHSLQK